MVVINIPFINGLSTIFQSITMPLTSLDKNYFEFQFVIGGRVSEVLVKGN